jgi:hypothetical protein
MAILGPFTNAKVVINAVDLSAYVKSVSIAYGAEILETTAMSKTTKVKKGGLKDWSVDLELNQDFAGGAVDATLFSLVGVDTTIGIRPVNTDIAATNPEYTGTAILSSYPPLDGTHGQNLTTKVHFEGSDTLTRDITP